jgi:hypothetical protein
MLCAVAALLGGARADRTSLLKADEVIFDAQITDSVGAEFLFVLRFSQLAAPVLAVDNWCNEKNFPSREGCAEPLLAAMAKRQLLDELTIADMRKHTKGSGDARCTDVELGDQGRKVCVRCGRVVTRSVG